MLDDNEQFSTDTHRDNGGNEWVGLASSTSRLFEASPNDQSRDCSGTDSPETTERTRASSGTTQTRFGFGRFRNAAWTVQKAKRDRALELDDYIEEWIATSGMTPALLDRIEEESKAGNGWIRAAVLGGSRARGHLYAFTGENAIIAALLLSVTIPLTVQVPDCLATQTIYSRLYGLLISTALALYMFAIAVTGVFNGQLATTLRDSDLFKLLCRWDKLPGLPTFAISIANFCIIGAVTCAYHECYGYSSDSFIYLGINFVFACSSLIINRFIRGQTHATMIPQEEMAPLLQRIREHLFL